jgi:hypothetical protein
MTGLSRCTRKIRLRLLKIISPSEQATVNISRSFTNMHGLERNMRGLTEPQFLCHISISVNNVFVFVMSWCICARNANPFVICVANQALYEFQGVKCTLSCHVQSFAKSVSSVSGHTSFPTDLAGVPLCALYAAYYSPSTFQSGNSCIWLTIELLSWFLCLMVCSDECDSLASPRRLTPTLSKSGAASKYTERDSSQVNTVLYSSISISHLITV